MATLSKVEIGRLLEPFLQPLQPEHIDKLSLYLDVLVKWNEKTNLTAIRDPAEMVTRHFGESIFASRHLGNPGTLLDLGSGAGFPGIPIAIIRRDIAVTLAESQNKKVAFLREVLRILDIKVSVYSGRAEQLPRGTLYDCVTLRGVDKMSEALAIAETLAVESVVLLTTRRGLELLPDRTKFSESFLVELPLSQGGVVARFLEP